MECKKLYELYGDRKDFPLIHELIDNTQSKLTPLKLDDKSLKSDPYIAWAVYNPKKKSVNGKVIISLVQNAIWIDTRWKIVSTNNEFVGCGNKTIYNTKYTQYDIEIKNIDINLFSSKEFKVELTTIWQEMGQNYLSAVQNIDTVNLETNTYVESIEVTDPSKQESGPHNKKEILIYYGRSPGSKELVDYDYSAQYYGTNVFLKLESSGSATLKKPFASADLSQTVLKIDWQKGSRTYNNSDEKIIISGDKNKLYWHFDPEWNVTLSKKFFESQNICDYDLYIEFYCQDVPEPQHIRIASTFDLEDLQPNCKKIPQLDLRLGCVAKGSLITMGDMSKKEIENVKKDDFVMTLKGKAKVINTFCGPENELVCICTNNQKQIMLSSTHSVYTDKGIFMARDINAGMKILTNDNIYEDILFIYNIDNKEPVYNLELDMEENASLFCQDIVIGDVNTKAESIDISEEINPELKKELEKLNDFLKGWEYEK